MNKQAVYNQVRDHLLTQNKKSEQTFGGVTVCAYRGLDGLKCAIGALIKDEEYNPKFNILDIESPEVLIMVEESLGLPGISNEEIDFLRELQEIHDTKVVTEWQTALKEFAISNSLVP